MKAISLSARACAFFVCLALVFLNTASAIGMASGNHAAMGSHSHATHTMHGTSSMDMASVDSSDQHKMSATDANTALSDSNCMEHASCVAECAVCCTAGAIFGSHIPAAISLTATYVTLVNHTPKSVLISDLYKPPIKLH